MSSNFGASLKGSDYYQPAAVARKRPVRATVVFLKVIFGQTHSIFNIYSSRFGQICYSKNLIFTVLSFGQVTNVFGHLYLVILHGQIWSSFFGHLNSPQHALSSKQFFAQSVTVLFSIRN